MNIKDIKRRIKEVQKEIINANGIVAVKLSEELETLLFLQTIKSAH